MTGQGILTETPAILQFVAEAWPKVGLAPLDDLFQMARINAFNSYLSSTVHVAHAHRMRMPQDPVDTKVLDAETAN